MFDSGMIVAQQPEAAEAGLEILTRGGNAIDAAIACAFVQSVVDPLMTGIAGFGAAIVRTASGETKCIDFHAPAPLASTEDMWAELIEGEARDGYGFILKGRPNDIGYQSICTPANLYGWYEVHRAFGTMPWHELITPAALLAEKGWVVRPHVHWFWSQEEEMGRAGNQDRLRYTEAGRKLFCREDGTPKKIGDVVENPEYAKVLRAIARDGIDVFYKGDIAIEMIRDIREHGGLLSMEDLAQYKPRWRDPIHSNYKELEMATNHPPGGGLMLAYMLNVLKHFDLKAIGHNTSEYIRIVSETMKRATALKDAEIGDPDFVAVDYNRFLDPDMATAHAEEIRRGVVASVPRLNRGSPSKDTTQVTVVDADGNCISMTHSLGMVSGVVTSNHGFMHNACMAVFDPRPGKTSSIAPGKARFSSICPTIYALNGEPVLVVGAPGATHIAMGMLQVSLNVFEFGMTMTEAVSAPRFSATSDVIDVSNRVPSLVTRTLEKAGYMVVRSPESFGFSYVHGIKINGKRLDGGADPGSGGVALQWKDGKISMR